MAVDLNAPYASLVGFWLSNGARALDKLEWQLLTEFHKPHPHLPVVACAWTFKLQVWSRSQLELCLSLLYFRVHSILVMNHQHQIIPRKRILETYDTPEPKRPQRCSIYEQFPQLRDPDKKLIAPLVVL
jgi:hypothetical protein